jgi:hypothetical protein
MLVNSRRLRLASNGITTADTLLPKTEAILRDFLLGQEWLRSNGMLQEPALLGAYILLFPRQRVSMMMGLDIIPMPALVVIIFWFALQLFSGIGSIGSASNVGGVAYMAHIGGFVTGLLLSFLFRTKA